MRIINPIYDVAFKYLLEDLDIAKKLIGKIIGEEITHLVFQPQEIATKSEHIGFLILRDLMRFRRYLGENYSKQIEITTNGITEKLTLPIITIYFLGFPLPEIETSVLKINREYIDLINGKKLQVKTEFVEKLTHDSFIILIPRLPPKERTELEGILKVFDQRYQLEADPKLLEINEEELKMLVEEEVESAFDSIVRKYEQRGEVIKEKDEALKEKDESIKEKQKIIEELKRQLNKGRN